MSNLLDLKDKTAAVIGASSGIGRAVSLLLAEHGANVVLCARRTDKLEETAALIRAQGGRAVTVAGDAVLPETHETVVRTAQREFGGLDIAINNAGTLGAYKPLAELSPEEWRATLDGNLTAAFLGARSQIPAMLARGGGAMVFTSSFVGTSCALPNRGRPSTARVGRRAARSQTHCPPGRNRCHNFIFGQPDEQFYHGCGNICGWGKFGGKIGFQTVCTQRSTTTTQKSVTAAPDA